MTEYKQKLPEKQKPELNEYIMTYEDLSGQKYILIHYFKLKSIEIRNDSILWEPTYEDPIQLNELDNPKPETGCGTWKIEMETRGRTTTLYSNIIKITASPNVIGLLQSKPNVSKKIHTGGMEEVFNSWTTDCKIPEPTPNPGEQGGNGQTNNPCNNTGQFGGGGTPLKDIKLFLYANNVTKGTIKLSKPQVEVGTFATDWRPNPSDYVERNSPAYKEIKGLAIQHNQDQNKKYIEVQATDGTVYGVDLWGGDAKKLLEQQQAEIEELKKMVQTLETKINV